MTGAPIPSWDTLNAFVDGEAPKETADDVDNLMAREESIACDVATLKTLKARLAKCQIEDLFHVSENDVSTTAANANSTATKRLAMAASAATLAIGAVWFAYADRPGNGPQGLVAWHEALSNNSYVVDQSDAGYLQNVTIGTTVLGIPDLRASNLYFVDMQVIDETAETSRYALHYSGLSGCRLTVWIGLNTQDTTPADVPNARRWSVGQMSFGIIATKMDVDRFQSVAAYVESATTQMARNAELWAAMDEAYRTANQCA